MKVTSSNFKDSKYSKAIVGRRRDREYPLCSSASGCPTARYVGGTSRYLCECKDPTSCPGVLLAASLYEEAV